MKPLEIRQHFGASIRYRVEVLNPDGTLAATLPWKKNLILDSGLNQIGRQFNWRDAVRYAVVGDSAEPTRRDSGAVTFTRAGDTLTASAGFFVEADNGRLIKLNDAAGRELRITGYTSEREVTVDQVIPPDDPDAYTPVNGTIWYVNQTGLQGAQIARSRDEYGSAEGDNSIVCQNGEVVMRRTFIFDVANALWTVREVCWKYYYNNGGDLYYKAFGRDVLAGGGLVLTQGQQLKIVLELHVQFAPATPQNLPALPWAGEGCRIQYENIAWDFIFNPARNGDRYLFVCDATDDFHPPSIGPNADGGGNPNWSLNQSATKNRIVGMTGSDYVDGTFTRTFTGVFDINSGNMEGITCFGIGWNYYDTRYSHLRVILTEPVSKDNSHILTIPFIVSWGRVLIN